jgi:hypothetical protein
VAIIEGLPKNKVVKLFLNVSFKFVKLFKT